jgi:alpha-D-ribose 1-methylphosphonate 5-triphosphate diphosphatase
MYTFSKGRVLTAAGLEETTLTIDDGRIAVVGGDPVGEPVDARGLIILPGIVDLHADAVERAIEPRPRVRAAWEIALAEDDAAALAAGITTRFLSLTDSFEPGLRSRATVRELLSFLPGYEHRLRVRSPIHLRHERCAVEDPEEVQAWIAGGRIGLLSLNDHVPSGGDAYAQRRFRTALARRLDLLSDEIDALVLRAAADRARGEEQCGRLCAAAMAHGIPLASHDDASPADADASLARGVRIGEFPFDRPTAERLRLGGAAVLMGAPNLVRGGSHVGWMGAAEAIGAGVVDALCSDYHYPSLFAAPFAAAQRGLLPFADAWRLVSAGPAAAAGLIDRGAIVPGALADLILVEPGPPPRLRAVWIAGREVARFA